MDDAEDTWYCCDHASWHGEPGYSRSVAEALCHAHLRLRAGVDGAAFDAAMAHLRPVLDATMSKRQRLHVLFLVGMILANADHPSPALDPIDMAIELALELDSARAQADLLILRASVNHTLAQVPDMAEDMRLAIELLAGGVGAAPGTARVDAGTRADLLLKSAMSEFLLGHADSCDRLLGHAAAALAAASVDGGLREALLRWTRAMLLRWRGEPEGALPLAMAAAETYAARGQAGSASRAHTLVVEIAADLAERFPPATPAPGGPRAGGPHPRDIFVAIAEPYLQRAISLAREDQMESSEVMAMIAGARVQLLRGDPGDRAPQLVQHAERARQEQDMYVAAQAYTQLGREYEARGDVPAAIRHYRLAVDVLRESEAVALGLWAQRALWRLDGEMRSEPQ